MKKWLVIVCVMALFIPVIVHGVRAKAAQPGGQWFSTMSGFFFCSKQCYDPADGSPVIVNWTGHTCSFGFSTCEPLTCTISCRDLLRMGMY